MAGQTTAGGRNGGAAARARRIGRGLVRLYPDAHCELRHGNAFELLAATILSAQCTDQRVNQVTPGLFRRYPTPAALGAAEPAAVEAVIRSTGFFRNKARALIGAAALIASRHGGEVPRTVEELTALPGVARKTANVVLGTAYGLAEGVVVDTHVGRLARRLGLSAESAPEKVEKDLMALFPRQDWTALAHRLIWHGRRVCAARAPACDRCGLRPDCPRIGVAPARTGVGTEP